jgi:hypothetical protein
MYILSEWPPAILAESGWTRLRQKLTGQLLSRLRRSMYLLYAACRVIHEGMMELWRDLCTSQLHIEDYLYFGWRHSISPVTFCISLFQEPAYLSPENSTYEYTHILDITYRSIAPTRL